MNSGCRQYAGVDGSTAGSPVDTGFPWSDEGGGPEKTKRYNMAKRTSRVGTGAKKRRYVIQDAIDMTASDERRVDIGIGIQASCRGNLQCTALMLFNLTTSGSSETFSLEA